MKIFCAFLSIITLISCGCATANQKIKPYAYVDLSEISVLSWTDDKPVDKAYKKYKDKYIEVEGYLLVYYDSAIGAYASFGLHELDLSRPLITIIGDVPNERGKKYRMVGKIIKESRDLGFGKFRFDISQWSEIKE